LVLRISEKKLRHFTGKAVCFIESQNTRRKLKTAENILIYTLICVRKSISVKNHTLFSIGTRHCILLIMALQKLSSAWKEGEN